MFRSFLGTMSIVLALCGCVSENDIIDPTQSSGAAPNYLPLENVWREDYFPHPKRPPADVLVLIDKSCSMVNERVQWIYSMGDFVQTLDDNYIDFHIGVTTTDPSELTGGKLATYLGKRWASPDDEDPVLTFIGLESSAFGNGEAGIEAAHKALTVQRETGNSGFFRYDAPLHIITISDEPDSSPNVGPKDLYDVMRRYEYHNRTSVAYSVIVNPYQSKICPGMWFGAGTGYIELARYWSDGEFIDICSSDWLSPIQNIADDLGQKIEYFYPLSRFPVEESIEVLVYEEPVTFDFLGVDDYVEETPLICRGSENTEPCYRQEFDYDSVRNGITFTDFIPEPHTQVTVGYFEATNYNEGLSESL